ncbi:hypothetical protein [Ornithinimicrobium pekingense]|nr:hypothetical protein [Ornithinimicrobium pekingense]
MWSGLTLGYAVVLGTGGCPAGWVLRGVRARTHPAHGIPAGCVSGDGP